MRAVASRLNGIKHLVLGNHDNFAKMNYTDFFICYGAYKFQREYLLTHIPVAPQQFYRFTANIHGHMHAQSMDDPRYWNVSCEQINCTPIEWSELKAKHAQT